MISILHPSRGRPEKSVKTMCRFLEEAHTSVEIVISLDTDDNLDAYKDAYDDFDSYHNYPQTAGFFMGHHIVVNKNRSAVDAINNAAKIANGDIFIIASDDTECFNGWGSAVVKEVEGKTDFILKTQDGIQPWIITNPILDRAYYNRTCYIYDPDFRHMFCDTWLTVQADISGRKLTSNLMFKHLNDTIKDDVRKRSDATWDEGQRTFIQKLKQTPVEDLRKITDQSMKNWIRTHAGIRL